MSHTVWFLTLPGVMVLDLTGPAETLKLAGDHFTLRYMARSRRLSAPPA